MSAIMTHPLRLHLQSLLLGLLLPALAHGQTFHWVGGSGDWGDASHWSATPDGPGGAGVPRQGDPVLLAPLERTTITIGRTAWCGGLRISGDAAPVVITGATNAELRVHGGLELSGEVRWDLPGALRFGGTAEGMPIDAGNVVIGSDVVFDGSGSWSLSCDLELAGDRDLLLEKGTLVTNGARMTARSIRKIGRGPQRAVIGSSVLQLREALLPELMSVLDMGNALQLVNGTPVPMATTMADGPERGITVCGTGPGQTQFVVDAQLVSDYNGFGVSCKGVCDGVVTATVTGGVGPFTYQWVGGPTTATWNNVCAGNQIVIVTDQGQSVSCAATVNVSDPALLSVIFFGVVPPACADVCDGSAQGIAVGGSGSYNYLWNGGQETGPAAFQLCAGPNTLEVTDANNCLFDTTFFLNVTPIEPNLSFTDATCFGGCDGTADVAPVGGTGVYSFLWAPAPPSGQGTPSVSGLCAGPWTVTVTDGNGCDTTVAFTINEPAPIEPNPSQVDASCGDVCDGSATVGPTGSPGPFSYFWDPPPPAGQGTEQATQLCAGTWNVTITDDGTGCDTTVQFIIDAPPVIDPVPTFTDASCSDLCDGTASVTPVGGTTPFTFLWTPSPPVGQGTGSVSGLCPGVWQVLIADAIGCDTTVEFVIGAPPSLDVNGLVTDATCANDCDGAIDVTVSGGTPGYGFTWSPAPPAGQGTPNVSGLCAGDWGVTVSDANGCDTTLIFTVNAPPPLDAQVLVNDATCGGNCDGTASAQVNGGTGPYTYLWTPAPPFGQGTDSVAGLCAGAWSLLITDVNGCDTTLNFQVDEPPALQVQFSVTDATCPSNCDGEAEATVSGGTLPYTFLWTPAPGAGQGTSLATGLCPGNYTLLITDALGCDTLVDFTIGAPPPIVPNATVTDATCSDVCDGSIVLAPSGGTPPFTFLWSPVPPNGQGQAEATGLCPGDWTVTITAIGGCDTTLTLTIGAPPALEVQLTTLDASCSGDCDGTAEAVVTGGTPGYSYLWSPAPGSGQGTPDAGGLCAGNYTLTVTDQVGCDTVLAFTISEPSPLDPQLSITDSGCGACDGVAVVDTVGGSGPHTFLWTPAPPQGQGTDSVSGLCPGLWEVLITDANGCDTLVAFTINTPSGIDALPAITDASCADVCDGAIDLTTTGGVPPYDFTWTPPPPVGQGTANVAGLCPGQWSVQIGDQAGCDTVLVFVVGAPPPLDPVPTVTNESCNGPCDGSATVSPVGGSGNYAFLWSPNPPQGQGTATASELCAGDWTITITDQVSGCDTTLTLTILPQQPIDPGLQALDATCWNICNGTATVSPTGGVGPYTYLWSPSPPFGQGTDSVAQLCQGLWQVTVTDALGCDTTVNFTITKPLPVVSSLSIQSETCDGPCTGAAAVFPFGGTGGYTFNWQPPPGGGQGTFFATGLCAGTSYSITITDSLGCDTTETFTVDPFIPITPNLSTEPPTCAGQCDGSATVGPVGGIA
ncbi:MAG TPA: SprB repeat-containing protein, partial [Flavobacteriales bacterium]|nr:SprB repeat-containing protein [Flavobacteriales bacterium]